MKACKNLEKGMQGRDFRGWGRAIAEGLASKKEKNAKNRKGAEKFV